MANLAGYICLLTKFRILHLYLFYPSQHAQAERHYIPGIIDLYSCYHTSVCPYDIYYLYYVFLTGSLNQHQPFYLLMVWAKYLTNSVGQDTNHLHTERNRITNISRGKGTTDGSMTWTCIMSLQLYNIVKLDRRADRCNSCRIIDEKQHRNKDIILVTTFKMWTVSGHRRHL